MESMDSVKTSLLEMLAFFQDQMALYSWWNNRYSTALVVLALILYRLFVIRNEIQRRRRDIGHGHLETVFNPANADFEIIAVQGLGSDPNSTWKSKQAPVKDDSDLLERLLPQRLPNARISRFIYNSDWDYDGSLVSPKQLGENLVDAFERHVKDVPLLPIVFICHSFGGIVTKHALLEAGNKIKVKDQNIWGATRGIIFLGTPHHGSSLSSFALAISYMNRFFGSRGELVAGLQPSNQSLIDLGRDFQNQLNNDKSRRVRIHSVQEMKQVMLFGLFSLGAVVGQSSAMMHAHKQSNWKCSHTELNKFPDIEDQRFKQLIGFIEELAPSSILQKVDKKLCKLYRSSGMFKVFHFSKRELDMDNCFINLGRVKETSRAIEPSQQSLMARLRLEETEEQERLELSTLFDQKKPGEKAILAKRFLIRGQAGIGKSTLCKKVLYEFYTKDMWRMKFDRILWIPLRQVPLLQQGNRTPEQLLIQALFSDSDMPLVTEMMEQLELDNFNRTLFLLDGMDEVHHLLNNHDAGFMTLLTTLIDKPNVIVTSRPHSRVQERKVPFDIEAEVLGFTPTQVDHYINNSGYDSPDEIREFLQNNPLVQSLARIPIQLDAICYTWNLEGTTTWNLSDPPRTMTELYQAMEVKFREIDVVRRKHLRKEELDERTSIDIRKLQEGDTKLMESLAFAGLCLHEVNFDFPLQDSTKTHFKIPVDRQESVPSIIHDLSFFRSSNTVLKSEGFRGTYHFLHLTFQEYFAARYFVRHWKDGEKLVYLSQDHTRHIKKDEMNARDFLNRYKYFPSFDVFWRFVSGLLKPTEEFPKDLQNDFFMALESEHRDELGPTHQRLVMHCLAEARSDMPLRIQLETTMSEWLCFELRRLRRHSRLAEEAEFPDSIVSVILQQAPSEIQSNLLEVLAERSHLSRTLLEDIEDFANENADNADIRKAAYAVLKKHTLTPNIILSVSNRAKDPDDKIGLPAIKLLASQGCLQGLPSDVIRRYIEHKDPEVLISLLDELKNPPQIFIDHLREWRRDANQILRSRTIRLLNTLTDIDCGLLESCLAPLEDDDLTVLAEAMESLERLPSLTPATWQAMVECTSEMISKPNEYRSGIDIPYRRTLVYIIEQARIKLLKAQQEKGGPGLASLLPLSQTSVQELFLEDFKSSDRLSHHILHALIKLLECHDMQICWTAFWILATQEHLPKACLDTMSDFFQSRLQNFQESWETVSEYFFLDRRKRGLSDQFLQSLAPLFRNGGTSVRRFCIKVLATQSNLPLQLLDAIDRTFRDVSNTNHDFLQLFEGFQILPELVEEAIAGLLGVKNSDVRSKASRVLQGQRFLRQSTLHIIARYLQNSQDRSIKLAAIEALRESQEVPHAFWDAFDLTFVEDDQETRQHIYSVLKRVNNLPAESWNRLTQVLERGTSQVRMQLFDYFLDGYKGVVPESTLQYIISLFPQNPDNQRFRVRITRSLGPRIYESSLASEFINSLLDDDHQVKLSFAEALDAESNSWKPDTDIILPLLQISTGGLLERILEFIYSKGEYPITDQMAAKLVQILNHESRELLREIAGYVLARHRSGANLHIIASLLGNSDYRIYNMASDVLSTWKTELPTLVLDVLMGILEDRSIGDDVKDEVLDILRMLRFNHETESAKALASKILPLLDDRSVTYSAFSVLWGYDNLSRSGLDKIILKLHSRRDQHEAFRLLLSRCDEADLSSFVNNPQSIGKFFELALDYSWDEAVSYYFVDDKTIQVNTPSGAKTVTLTNPEAFRISVQKAREGYSIPLPGVYPATVANAH
ncbi:hypothetical protein NW768_012142 [Fusarium equiseti]|uniref:Protein SERAC1 n=1 Tax=Fusarium equiseti TaxID=61235 RepID=A0ABQ8QVR0_FUSEQ|nr:hypothetical protein NW768_012142 [Fusarium equiseti]